MKIHPRKSWGATPAKAVTPVHPTRWKGVVVHWFGSPRAARTHAGCPRLIRAVQRVHKMGEYTDIAYNLLVCPHGHVYAGRGISRQGGANGTRQSNRDYVSICVMMGVGDEFTPQARIALRDTIAYVRSKGAKRVVKRHGEITGSECPGPAISAWVEAKKYEPAPKKAKPKPHC